MVYLNPPPSEGKKEPVRPHRNTKRASAPPQTMVAGEFFDGRPWVYLFEKELLTSAMHSRVPRPLALGENATCSVPA